ncbi:hypothetical protein DFH08DRAFT_1014100 [Mycena albidolilacea]|uniref:Uncharacterized protein n=1 Tax=Mycena albidolilacea TaxID=1033008 RepID=A0AAD6ZTR6_9AGAR|nr:hypothetical protein DFH08DRAFT_1014100 [Mycena albidolilacea]
MFGAMTTQSVLFALSGCLRVYGVLIYQRSPDQRRAMIILGHIPRPAHAPPAIDVSALPAARPARYCTPTRCDPPKIIPWPSALPAFLNTFLRHAVSMCYPPPAPPCVCLLSRPAARCPGSCRLFCSAAPYARRIPGPQYLPQYAPHAPRMRAPPTPVAPTQCALPRPRRALRTSARRAAPTPGPESFLRDAPQALRTLTPPVAVVCRPSTRRPAPTADCVPCAPPLGPLMGSVDSLGFTPGAHAWDFCRSCCAEPVRAGPPLHGAPSCGVHPPAARYCCADPGHSGLPPTPHCALYYHSLSVLADLVALMDLCLLAGYLRTHCAPYLESLCLMRCDACAAHAPGALPLHPHVAQLSVPQLVRLLSTAPCSPASPAPALPHLTSVMLAPPPPQASRPSTPSPPVHTLALEDASHPAVTPPADVAPLLSLVSANPVALAIEATKTVCVRGSPGVFALGAGAVDHAATGVALQALVGAALGVVCTPSCASHPVAAAPVDTALLLADVFALARFPGLAHLATRPLRVARLELGADPAALAIEAAGTVCVRGSPGPFAIGAGAALRALETVCATLQVLVCARGGAARCMEAAYAGAAHAHGGVPEEYLVGVLVFRTKVDLAALEHLGQSRGPIRLFRTLLDQLFSCPSDSPLPFIARERLIVRSKVEPAMHFFRKYSGAALKHIDINLYSFSTTVAIGRLHAAL